MSAEQAGNVATGENGRLPGSTLRSAGDSQGGISRDQAESIGADYSISMKIPIVAEKGAQSGEFRRYKRVNGRIRTANADPIQKEKEYIPLLHSGSLLLRRGPVNKAILIQYATRAINNGKIWTTTINCTSTMT